MNAFERKVALRVLGIHVGVFVFFLLVAGLKGCFRPKPKPEIVTFIEFGSPAPQVNVQQVEQMSEPEPPAPEPTPEPAPIPEPVKKTVPKPTPKPKPKPKPVPKPEPKPDPKPKWKATKASDINPNKSKRIVEKPSKPAVSDKDISKALSGIQSSSKKTTGPVGNPDAIAAYDAHIYNVFYNAWERPPAPASRPAKVTLSISSSGRILSSRLSQSSGDSAWDATVLAAVGRVKILPKKPPAGYPLNNIVVQFRIID